MGAPQESLTIGVASGDWVGPNLTHDGSCQWGGSGWARVGQYLDHLPYKSVVGTLMWSNGRFGIVDTERNARDVDIVILQRLTHAGIAANIPIAQANGQKIINDIDDWYWGVDPTNKAFHYNHPKTNPDENINHYRSILSRSDLVMVSTTYLLDRLSSWVKCPMVLTPNTIDLTRFTMKQHVDDGPPLVGWVGSTAHRSRDIETVSGVLKPMYGTGQIRLHHSGAHPEYPTFASRIGVPVSAVSTLPLATTDLYPSLMVMDIGIVPLRDTPFNRAKSCIKGLEYAAAGVPFVAQDLDAYVELAGSGIGRIAKRPVNWVKHIKALMSADVRNEEAALNRERVAQYDIQLGVNRLTDIITNL